MLLVTISFNARCPRVTFSVQRTFMRLPDQGGSRPLLAESVSVADAKGQLLRNPSYLLRANVSANSHLGTAWFGDFKLSGIPNRLGRERLVSAN